MRKVVAALLATLIIIALLSGVALAETTTVSVSVHVTSKVVVSLDGGVEANLPYEVNYSDGLLTVVPFSRTPLP